MNALFYVALTFAELLLSGLFLLVFILESVIRRNKFLSIWTVGWFFLTLQNFFRFLGLLTKGPDLLSIAVLEANIIGNVIFLLAALSLITSNDYKKPALLAIGVASLWSVYVISFVDGGENYVKILPNMAFVGIVTILTGYYLYLFTKNKGLFIGKIILPTFFILGALRIISPLILPTDVMLSYVSLSKGFLFFLSGVEILLLKGNT